MIIYFSCQQREIEKLEQKRIDELEMQEKKEILDSLVKKVPYFEQISNIQPDPERLKMPTASFEVSRALLKAEMEEKDSEGMEGSRLQPIRGYSEDQIFSDVRFKITEVILLKRDIIFIIELLI